MCGLAVVGLYLLDSVSVYTGGSCGSGGVWRIKVRIIAAW